MKYIQRCPPHRQLTSHWTSSLGIGGRHRPVQVDTFVGSAHPDRLIAHRYHFPPATAGGIFLSPAASEGGLFAPESS